MNMQAPRRRTILKGDYSIFDCGGLYGARIPRFAIRAIAVDLRDYVDFDESLEEYEIYGLFGDGSTDEIGSYNPYEKCAYVDNRTFVGFALEDGEGITIYTDEEAFDAGFVTPQRMWEVSGSLTDMLLEAA